MMGGYIIESGQKFETADEYIDHLERTIDSVRSKTALDVVAEKLQAQDALRRAEAALRAVREEFANPEGGYDDDPVVRIVNAALGAASG